LKGWTTTMDNGKITCYPPNNRSAQKLSEIVKVQHDAIYERFAKHANNSKMINTKKNV
jgi:hypothetical protein